MIDDPDFTLELGPSWEEIPDEDPRLHKFFEAERRITLVVRAMDVDIPPDRLDDVADILLQLRVTGEREHAAAAGLDPVIFEPIVVPQVWGRAAAFYGHDETGRQFSFSGFVTCRFMIGVYGSSDRLSERELLAALDEVLSAIEFDRTPLPELHGKP